MHAPIKINFQEEGIPHLPLHELLTRLGTYNSCQNKPKIKSSPKNTRRPIHHHRSQRTHSEYYVAYIVYNTNVMPPSSPPHIMMTNC